MTIKEVEKVTGLTAKGIRFYEEKGLIHIKRDKNGYRHYTDDDVHKLQFIKILRYLDFNIKEISDILKDHHKLEDGLKQKSLRLEEQNIDNLSKQNLCDQLLKQYQKEDYIKIINNYSETIEFLESHEGRDFVKDWFQILCPHISAVIIQSFVFLGPIFWLFINIYQKQWDRILLNSIAAIICTVFLVLEWVNYFHFREKNKHLLKEKNKSNLLVIPALIIVIIVVVLLFGFLSVCVEYLFIPDNFLFYEHSFLMTYIMILTIVIFAIMSIVVLLNCLKMKRIESLDIYMELWHKFKIPLVIGFIIILYCFITSVTIVTEDTIICRHPLNPLGENYQYSDINKIETGFGHRNFSLMEYKRKGQFYYTIYLDRKSVTFHFPSINEKIERYEEHTYLELEEFDERLVDLGVTKISSDENSEYCDLDKEYYDRFLKIIHNISDH